MGEIETITNMLGGPRVLGTRPASTIDLVGLIRDGLPYPSFTHLIARLEISKEDASRVLGLPSRTLDRRRRTARLDAEQSERLLRLARVVAKAIQTLGDAHKAMRWLRKSNRSLGGVTPLSLLDTDIGTQAVDDVLGRIQHGIPG